MLPFGREGNAKIWPTDHDDSSHCFKPECRCQSGLLPDYETSNSSGSSAPTSSDVHVATASTCPCFWSRILNWARSPCIAGASAGKGVSGQKDERKRFRNLPGLIFCMVVRRESQANSMLYLQAAWLFLCSVLVSLLCSKGLE